MKFTDICFITPDVPRLRTFYEAVFGGKAEGDEVHVTLGADGLRPHTRGVHARFNAKTRTEIH